MMTLQEIQAAQINIEVAREALTQVAQRLQDTHAVSGGHDQKAFALLAGFVAVSLGVFGAVAGLLMAGEAELSMPFLVAGFAYVVGAACCMAALWDRPYGTLGSDPEMWLNTGTIDGDATALGRMLAYVTYYHKARIDRSVQSNRTKAKLLRFASILGIAATGAIGLWLACLG